ncbi:hypothetical protein FKM82_006938 [Ascaphus truei]
MKKKQMSPWCPRWSSSQKMAVQHEADGVHGDTQEPDGRFGREPGERASTSASGESWIQNGGGRKDVSRKGAEPAKQTPSWRRQGVTEGPER